MNREIKSVLTKTVKIAGVTCFALGGAALIAGGAAVKALTEGAKYIRESVKTIIDEKPDEAEAIHTAEQASVEELNAEAYAAPVVEIE